MGSHECLGWAEPIEPKRTAYMAKQFWQNYQPAVRPAAALDDKRTEIGGVAL
jgi:hypothetical protein